MNSLLHWPELKDRPEVSFDEFRRLTGTQTYSDWIVTTQDMFDSFAEVTGDDAFIHVDPEAAEATRFGGTIAHGLLTLSMLPRLLRSATPVIVGTRMGVNYGYDRVRFLTPVPCGAKVRGRFTLEEIDERSNGLTVLHYDAEVEIAGSTKLALAAKWLIGRWIRSHG